MLDKLKKPFPPELISWRVGATTKNKDKGIALAYIDARDVMERFDDVFGAENWQCEYPFKGCCRIGVLINDRWVWKSNGAGETQVEADKGQYSDAFKRAAVLWGVGRYLYDVQNVWVELDQYRKIKNPTDSRLQGALEKAAKGIRPAPTQALKKITPAEWASKEETLINSFTGSIELDAWMSKNAAAMEKLKSGSPVLHKGLQMAVDNKMDQLQPMAAE